MNLAGGPVTIAQLLAKQRERDELRDWALGAWRGSRRAPGTGALPSARYVVCIAGAQYAAPIGPGLTS